MLRGWVSESLAKNINKIEMCRNFIMQRFEVVNRMYASAVYYFNHIIEEKDNK